jgi:flagellar basal body-associated protein FliL
MDKKKLIIIAVVLLGALGGVYKFVIAKPAAVAKPKIAGTVYVLPKEFVLNLADGHFAKLGIGLVLDPKDESLAKAAENKEAPTPPDGFGPLPQEAVIRDIVTGILTDRDAASLTDRGGRERLKQRIVRTIIKRTDVEVDDVLFTDVAVQ